MQPTIYVDMDDVLVDFVSDCIDRYDLNIDWEDHLRPSDFINAYTYQYGETLDDLVNDLDDEFWEFLSPTPEMDQIVALLEPYKPIILTSCAWGGASGKQLWIEENLPDYYFDGRYIMVGHASIKNKLAKSNTILIDDLERNVDEFTANGGIGILCPRPWNRARNIGCVEGIQQQLITILGDKY